MYERILISIDGSTCSYAALRHGICLAREEKAGVRIIHVIDEQSVYAVEGVYEIYLEATQEARRRSDEIMNRATDAAGQAGIEHVETAVIESNGRRIPDLIAAEAEHWSADLIVMGTHARRGVGRLLFGSVADAVMHATSVPVLLIHPPVAGESRSRVA
ncbi:MAG TPA: universal stress protein [bacterium]|nr:universal stress protein [bacterium]